MPSKKRQRRRPARTQDQIDAVDDVLAHELACIANRDEAAALLAADRRQRAEKILKARSIGISTGQLADELEARGHSISKQALLHSSRY